MPLDPLPPLKTDPKHGHFPWSPEDGDGWVHPEDVELARSVIPSPRIWRRGGVHGDFVVLHYGATRLRVRHALWREAPHEGFDVGDAVEVRPLGMKNDPVTGKIRDVHWDKSAEAVRYYVTVADGTLLEKAFAVEDLKPVEAPSPRAEGYVESCGDE